MATYYVKGTVSGAGSGTAIDPWKQLSSLPALASGDIVYLADVIRFDPIDTAAGGYAAGAARYTGTDLTNVTFDQWSGQAKWELRGDQTVTQAAWSDNGDGTYSANIGTNRYVVGVTVDSDNKIDTFGSYGHLPKAASAAAVTNAADGWFYTAATGILKISPLTDGSPMSEVDGYVKYCEGNYGVGLYLPNATGCRIYGGIYRFHCDGATGMCYPAAMYGTDNVMDGFVADNSGYHGPSFVGLAAGRTNARNVIRNAKFQGCTWLNGTVAPTLTVFYSTDQTVTGCVVDNCEFYGVSARGPAGAVLNTSKVVDGVYFHAASGKYIADLLVRNSRFNGWYVSTSDITPFRPWGGTNTADLAAAGDVDLWAKYPVRVVNCKATGTHFQMPGGAGTLNSNIAMHRCQIDVQNYQNLPGTGWVSAFAANAAQDASAVETHILFDHTVLVGYVKSAASATRHPSMFRLGVKYHGHGVAATFIETSADGTGAGFKCMIGSANNADLSYGFKRSAFVYQTQHASHNFHQAGDTGSCVVTGHLGNHYCNHSSSGNTFSNRAGALTQANWLANVDTTGVARNSVTSGVFKTPLMAGVPVEGDTLRTSSARTAYLLKDLGINCQPDRGRYGAWQDGNRTLETIGA